MRYVTLLSGVWCLVSNSELYVEDAVNQLGNSGEDEKDGAPRFKNVNRYFSRGSRFERVLEHDLFFRFTSFIITKDFIAKQTNIAKWFKGGRWMAI